MQMESWNERSEAERSVALLSAMKLVIAILHERDLLKPDAVQQFGEASARMAKTLGGEGATEALKEILTGAPHFPAILRASGTTIRDT